jgi:hypothetical protein
VTTTRLGYYLQCRLFNELVCIGANVSRLARLSMRLHTAAADSSGTALRRLSLNSSASLQGSSSCCQRFLKTATSGTHEVTQVTGATTRKGPLVDANYPARSPDGELLAFTARGKRERGRISCVNFDIFSIKADGTGTLGLLTNTVGTQESFSQWGW